MSHGSDISVYTVMPVGHERSLRGFDAWNLIVSTGSFLASPHVDWLHSPLHLLSCLRLLLFVLWVITLSLVE